MRLEGRSVLITGFASRLSEASAIHFAKLGLKVAIWDLNSELGAKIAEEIGGRFYHCNVKSEESVRSALGQTFADLGRIDIVLNFTEIGVSLEKPEEASDQESGVEHASVLLDNHMAQQEEVEGERGVFINISNTGQPTLPGDSSGLTQATDSSELKVRVKVIVPGDLIAYLVESKTQEFSDFLQSESPNRRFANSQQFISFIESLIKNKLDCDASFLIGGLASSDLLKGQVELPKTISNSSLTSTKRIDTHHHIIPPFYSEALATTGLDLADPASKWSVAGSKDLMLNLGVETTIISISCPGAAIFPGERGRQLARDLNEFCANLCAECPLSFGFFASLPNLTDIEGTLAEIQYSLNALKADGFIVFSSYHHNGSYLYLGHPSFKPIWDLLDSYSAVVFVHPSRAPTPKINKHLLYAVIDFPIETTKTAADLLTSATVKDHPNIKFILSHAGGTLPYLAQRLSWAGLDPRAGCPLSPESLLDGMRSFYYDIALSSTPAQLQALLQIASPDRILYGSDTPFAPPSLMKSVTNQLDKFFSSLENGEILLDKINRNNALKLFPKKFGLEQPPST